MALRLLGAEGLREVVDRLIGLARHLHRLVQDHPDFEVLHEPRLYLYCCRYVPNTVGDRCAGAEIQRRIDALNQAIADEIQRSGLAFVMTTRIHGRVALRMSICSHRTTQADIDDTFAAMARLGRQLTGAMSVGQDTNEEMQPC